MWWHRFGRAATLLSLLVGVPACGDAPTTTLRVFAASSLTETFTALAHSYEQAHPGVRVSLDFGGSTALARQIVEGAPADVFAAASSAAMSTVTAAHLGVGTPVVFARNRLEIAVPVGSAKVSDLRGSTAHGVRLALCAPSVPCGAAARRLYAAEGLTAHPVTEEQDVRGVLTKVRLGEVDAGLVYVTDVRAAAGAVTGVPVPDVPAALATYSITVVTRTTHARLAQQLQDLLTGNHAQQVLRTAGFLPAG